MLGTLLLVAVVAMGPTRGDVLRELADDDAAFRRADRNGDGFISDLEVDRYMRRQGGGDYYYGRRPSLGGYDINRDEALTPFELYPEADYRLRPNYSDIYGRFSPYDDGYYYVDDRTGRVYDGRYAGEDEKYYYDRRGSGQRRYEVRDGWDDRDYEDSYR